MEIGVPFSDPVADGPVIQASSQKALAQGVTLNEALEMAGTAHREHGLEIVLMGYLNPILHLGAQEFTSACQREKVAGVIVPDLPPEESAGLRAMLAENDVSLIDLVAPTTSQTRLEAIAPQAAGFLYLVSVTGVTGSSLSGPGKLTDYLQRVQEASDLPGYVGFGVSTATQAVEICTQADGVVMGSALIRLIEEAATHDEAVTAFSKLLNDISGALARMKG